MQASSIGHATCAETKIVPRTVATLTQVQAGGGIMRASATAAKQGPSAGKRVTASNIAVEDRVVRLSGRGDRTHAVLALRRLAASASCVAAIIDDPWVDCE